MESDPLTRAPAALFESAAIALPTRDQEVSFLSEVSGAGAWSCCDVWIYGSSSAWATDVTVRLYGRTGLARVLLETVQMASVPSTTASGVVSALAISMRGHPCSSFEVTCTSSSTSAIAEGRAYLQVWSGPSAGADGSVLPTREARASAGSQTSVAQTATSVTLLASNAKRLAATIYNDSTAPLFVRLQASASTTDFSARLRPQGLLVVDDYTGIIDGVWSAAGAGAARVTELT